MSGIDWKVGDKVWHVDQKMVGKVMEIMKNDALPLCVKFPNEGHCRRYSLDGTQLSGRQFIKKPTKLELVLK